MVWSVVALAKSHVRDRFSCGVPSLDTFLKQYAGQYSKRNLGRTYVLVRAGDPQVFGYYTLSGGHVPRAEFPDEVAKTLPNHPVPVVLLARLAVDVSVRGQGLGRVLLANALARSAASAEQIGFYAVFTEAIDESAAAFYRKHGFTPLRDQSARLFLPVSAIK
jgi:GNAT superfamily N-acetyltransferase